MSDLIETIIQTRKTAADIFVKSLENLDENSEVEIREKILVEIATRKELFPDGWYSPPPAGIAVLLDQKPFTRLQFKTLRKPEAWPSKTSRFKKETVGIVYISPVDRKTGMFGDIGFTIYNGNNQEIREHIKKCYTTILTITKKAEVGMKFSELHKLTEDIFKKNQKLIGWITTTNDPAGTNLGHTVPGLLKENFFFQDNFEKIKDKIEKNRIYINGVEDFKIPETSAFTVEARLVDVKKKYLPNVFFHFMVCFDKGEKIILENFEEIFSTVGMDYMNT